MTWLMEQQNNDEYGEPIELQDLKLKLAKLSCKCLKKRTKPIIPATEYKQSHNPLCEKVKNDKEVQAECCYKDQLQCGYIRVDQATSRKEGKDSMFHFNKENLCPGCFVTMNFLRWGPFKVLKDEESETKHDMFSRDKSTGNCVKSLEQTTSVSNKLAMRFSNLSLCDYLSEDSSEISLQKREPATKRSHLVKFEDVPVNTPPPEQAFTGACFCLENLMEAIRPPLQDADYFVREKK